MTSSASLLSAAEDSVLAPLLISARLPASLADYLPVVWAAAAASVPITKPMLNVQNDAGKLQAVATPRIMQHRSGVRCLLLARLCDERSAESSKKTWGTWRWEVSARAVAGAATADRTAGAPALVRLEVTRFRISSGEVLSASELALFRHLVVSGLRASDPELTVVGGQQDWDHEWWRIPPPAIVS